MHQTEPMSPLAPSLRYPSPAPAEWSAPILPTIAHDRSVRPQPVSHPIGRQGLSLWTIGRLISGVSERSPEPYRFPIIDPHRMARKLTVTFRPLPEGYTNEAVIRFREELWQILASHGVTIEPWETSTIEQAVTIKLPAIGSKQETQVPMVRSGIHAVIDVARPASLIRKAGRLAAENFYHVYSRWVARNRSLSVSQIAHLMDSAREQAAHRVQDPTTTQIIVLTELHPDGYEGIWPYARAIQLGNAPRRRPLTELVIGIDTEQFAILPRTRDRQWPQRPLSEPRFPHSESPHYVLKAIIPQLYVSPVPPAVQRLTPTAWPANTLSYVDRFLALQQGLAHLSFPGSAPISPESSSHPPYGCIAYAEPPQYIDDRTLNVAQWNSLQPVTGFSIDEVRQNSQGRWYVKTRLRQAECYQQIPDLWLISHGNHVLANDNRDRGLVRVGFQQGLWIQLPEEGNDAIPLQPSGAIYGLVALTIAIALYAPALLEDGMPLVHLHGYPTARWFAANEYWTGVDHPLLPPETYESGVLHFLGLHRLIQQAHTQSPEPTIRLASLIDPHAGSYVMAQTSEYLIQRLAAGCRSGDWALGRHFLADLQQAALAPPPKK